MPIFESSLKDSFNSQVPTIVQSDDIVRIKKAADILCEVIDQVTPHSREAALAKTHLEETVMWATKSIVLPRD